MLELVRGGFDLPGYQKKIPGFLLPFPPPPGRSLGLITGQTMLWELQAQDGGTSIRGQVRETGACRQGAGSRTH